MRRVAVTLALLALGLAVPVAILVARALESAKVEEENRHRSLAERAFDEMEDALSRFLADEETRPFDAYRFYSETQPLRRSPLSYPPERDFVIGYLQIDPDGSLHSPRIPLNLELAARRGDFQPSPEIRGLEALLKEAWQRPGEQPRPGVLSGKVAALRALKGEIAEDKAPGLLDSYDVYRSLNRATERRAQRKQKVTTVPARKLPARSTLAQGGFASVAEVAPEPEAEPARGRVAFYERDLAFAAPKPRASVAATARSDRRNETTLRVALDPMVGRAVGPDRLLLYRTVVVGQQGYRQGMLIDWLRLGEWLDAQVIAPSGLGRAARVAFFGREPDAADPDEMHVYRHRFAEPFDAFGLELALPTLPGGRGSDTIYALAALLAVVAAGGLFAVYRMVAVVVHFAERRNRFVAAVSHELKTPLTSIRMYAEMLRDGLVSSERKRDEYYHTITDESERLSRLIDNVLDFSRLEKGEYEVDVRQGRVLPVVEEAVRKLSPHAQRQGFTLALRADADLPDVSFDPDALTQVIFNLVDNALKYARSASRKEILISCCATDGTPGVALTVRDFGPGVPASDLDRVFEPFYRREDELTRTTKGTGIGLALVRELVGSMGGSTAATNAPEGGLEVQIRLRDGR